MTIFYLLGPTSKSVPYKFIIKKVIKSFKTEKIIENVFFFVRLRKEKKNICEKYFYKILIYLKRTKILTIAHLAICSIPQSWL